MQKHKKLKQRIVSSALSVALITSMWATNVFATDSSGLSQDISPIGIILSFDKLDERFIPGTGEDASPNVYSLTVEANTTEEELNLPTELMGMVERTTLGTPSETEEQGNINEEVTSEEEILSGDTEGFVSEEEILSDDTQEFTEGTQTTVTTVTSEIIPVKWNSEKEFVSDKNGGPFIYTAEPQEGYRLADGVEPPQIYVFAGNRQTRAASAYDSEIDLSTISGDGTGYVYNAGTKKLILNGADGTKYRLHGDGAGKVEVIEMYYAGELTLDGVTIETLQNEQTFYFSASGSAKKTTITLVGENHLSNANKTTLFAATDNMDILIGGSGDLNITSSEGGGIHSEGTLELAGTGMISVESKLTGINGRTSVTIQSGTIHSTSSNVNAILSGSAITISGGNVTAHSNSVIAMQIASGAITFSGNNTVVKAKGGSSSPALSHQPSAEGFTVTPEGETYASVGIEVTWKNVVTTNAAFSGLTANGEEGISPTTELTLTFDKDIAGLSVDDITVTGATKGKLTKVDGETGQYKLAISDITVANGENVTVAVEKEDFIFTPSGKDVAIVKVSYDYEIDLASAVTKDGCTVEKGKLTLTGEEGKTYLLSGDGGSNVTGVVANNSVTITLDNAKITSSGNAIYLNGTGGETKILLKGANALSAQNNGAMGIRVQKDNLIISGSGNLHIKGYAGILSNAPITISGCSVNIESQSSGIETQSITSSLISNSAVEVTSAAGAAIYTAGSVSIQNSKLAALTNGTGKAGIIGGAIAISGDDTIVRAKGGPEGKAMSIKPSAEGFDVTPEGETWESLNTEVTWEAATPPPAPGDYDYKINLAGSLGSSGRGYTLSDGALTLTGAEGKTYLLYGDGGSKVKNIIVNNNVEITLEDAIVAGTNVDALDLLKGGTIIVQGANNSIATTGNFNAITSKKDLTIKGTGVLTVPSSLIAINSSKLEISSVTLNASTSKDSAWVLYSNSSININKGATVVAEAACDNASAIYSQEITIADAGTKLTVKGTHIFDERGGMITAKDATITGATTVDGTLTAAAISTDSADAGKTIRMGADGKGEIALHAVITIDSAPPTPPAAFTVTINGGGTNASGSGSYGKDATVTIHAGTKNGSTFRNWTSNDGVVFADANRATTTFTMPAKAVTITANWTKKDDTIYEPSGGGSSSGGGGGSTSAPTTKDELKNGTATVAPTVDDNGNASITVTDKVVLEAIQVAQAAAKKEGLEGKLISVEIIAKTDDNSSQVSATLPKTVQETLISNKVDSVKITTNTIAISFDKSAIAKINAQAKADVTITAVKADTAELTGKAKELIGARPMFDLNAVYGAGERITDFGGSAVTVAIPYELGEGEEAENVCAIFVDENSNASKLEDSSYDEDLEAVVFTTDHFSKYGVGYEAKAVEAEVLFNDIDNHWAKADIEAIVRLGILAGTGHKIFSPDIPMTRGMFVTALGRMAAVETENYQNGKFTDVKADMYYASYINWAAEKGIVTGMSSTSFAPDKNVTRQEMAAMIVNFSKATGVELPQTLTETTFADNDTIAVWAAPSVKQMQMAGLLAGKDANRFDPTGTSTRAEVAATLYRHVKLVADDFAE